MIKVRSYTHPAVLDDARMRLNDHAAYIRMLPTLIKLVRTGAFDFGERVGEVVG